jgi:hypothetical protein
MQFNLALTHSPAVKAAEAETAKRSWLIKENQSGSGSPACRLFAYS